MITDRRSMLTGLAVAVASPLALATLSSRALAAIPMISPTELKVPLDFYGSVLPRAELSLATSQIAVGMATQKNTMEFAAFELGEAITVNMVLKDLGAMAPKMDGDTMMVVETMKTAEKGRAFDEAYIALQLKNHEELRDLADAFLHNTAGGTDPDVKQGRHLASLMLAVFKEHVAICKRITGELKA